MMQSGFMHTISQWTTLDEKLLHYVEKEDLVKVRHLLKKNVCPTKLHPMTGKTCLHYSIEKGNLNLTKILAQDPNTDVNCKDLSGKNLLYHAIARGHMDIAEYLLEKGATFKNEDQDGRALLEKSVTLGDLDKVTLLLYGDCPANCAGEFGYTPLHIAAGKGQASISKVLIDKGVNINEKTPTGLTALMIAAMAGHAHLCSFLLNNGADRNAVDNEGHDATWHAIRCESYEACKVISDFDNHHKTDELQSSTLEDQQFYHEIKDQLQPSTHEEDQLYHEIKEQYSEQPKSFTGRETGHTEELKDKKVDDGALVESENYKILKKFIDFDDAKDLIMKIEQTLETVSFLDDERKTLKTKLKEVNFELDQCRENLDQAQNKISEMDKELKEQKYLAEENAPLKGIVSNQQTSTKEISNQNCDGGDDDDRMELLSQISNLQKECNKMQNEKNKLKFQICQFIDSRHERNSRSNDLQINCYQTIANDPTDKLQELINTLNNLIQRQNIDLTERERELEHLIGLFSEFGTLPRKNGKNIVSIQKDFRGSSNISLNGGKNFTSVINEEIKCLKEEMKKKEDSIEKMSVQISLLQKDLENERQKVMQGKDISSVKEKHLGGVTTKDVHLDKIDGKTDTRLSQNSYKYIEFNNPGRDKTKKCVSYLSDENCSKSKKDVGLQCPMIPLDSTKHHLPLNFQFKDIESEVEYLREANRSLSLEVADLQYKLYERSQLIRKGISFEATEYRNILHKKMKEHGNVVASYQDQIDKLNDEIKRLKEERRDIQRMNDSLEMDLQDLREIFKSRNYPSSDSELVKKLRCENKKFQSLLDILQKNIISGSNNIEMLNHHKVNEDKSNLMELNSDYENIPVKNVKNDIHSEYQEEITRLNELLNKTEKENRETISRLREYLLLSIQGTLDQEVKEALVNILRVHHS